MAARINDTGALVLSEFTGASEQMTEAWLINPYDIGGMKRTILDALNEPAEQRAAHRMAALRARRLHPRRGQMGPGLPGQPPGAELHDDA